MNNQSTTTLPNAEFDRLARSLEQDPVRCDALAKLAAQSKIGDAGEGAG